VPDQCDCDQHDSTIDSVNYNNGTWKFKGPVAILKDSAGRTVAAHYGNTDCAHPADSQSPAWSFIGGGELTVSKVAARDHAGSIPELVLKVMSNTNPTGHSADTEVVGRATHIERLQTTGGAAPAESCSVDGQVRPVHYTATYRIVNKNAEAAQTGGASGGDHPSGTAGTANH
jgi:hypothetical protein